VRKEVLMAVGSMVALAELSKFAFTSKQKRAIRERDGHQCNFPNGHDCNGHEQLHIHHLLPQRYCANLGIDPDYGENGLTICQNSHVQTIHPDMTQAKNEYRQGNKDAFAQKFEDREQALLNKEIYWNPDYDRAMIAVAIRNTQRAVDNGWKFPDRRSRNGKTHS